MTINLIEYKLIEDINQTRLDEFLATKERTAIKKDAEVIRYIIKQYKLLKQEQSVAKLIERIDLLEKELREIKSQIS